MGIYLFFAGMFLLVLSISVYIFVQVASPQTNEEQELDDEDQLKYLREHEATRTTRSGRRR